MTVIRPRPRGRPKTSPFPRAEQLRRAKRAQRDRERRQGLAHCTVKLPRRDAERLKVAMADPAFARRLGEFVREHVIAVADYPGLAGLLWNRRRVYVTGEEAFRLYERNWRFVDAQRLLPPERELVERLVRTYGHGVLLA